MLWEKGKFQLILSAKESNTNKTNWDFSLLRQVSIIRPPGEDFGDWFWAVLGGQHWDRIFEKTRVGSGSR